VSGLRHAKDIQGCKGQKLLPEYSESHDNVQKLMFLYSQRLVCNIKFAPNHLTFKSYRNPSLRVAFIDEVEAPTGNGTTEKTYYSVLVKGGEKYDEVLCLFNEYCRPPLLLCDLVKLYRTLNCIIKVMATFSQTKSSFFAFIVMCHTHH
jgi:hypothetical protein